MRGEELVSFEDFKKKFGFIPKKIGLVGVEREQFVVDTNGNIVPMAAKVLEHLSRGGRKREFGYELSACQVESRVGPVKIGDLYNQLSTQQGKMDQVVKSLGLDFNYHEVGPHDMPLDVYPDPTGRYQKIIIDMPREVLLAACRVMGTHVHIGMPSIETAIEVYNRVIANTENLCRMGDHSNGERLAIYKVMAKKWEPKPFMSPEHFYEVAKEEGFVHDPRKCWYLIRISVHGTIEFRMFGSTWNLNEILGWAKACHKLCFPDW